MSSWAAQKEIAKRQKKIWRNPGLSRCRMISRRGSDRAENGL
jgi:hypothetical protein